MSNIGQNRNQISVGVAGNEVKPLSIKDNTHSTINVGSPVIRVTPRSDEAPATSRYSLGMRKPTQRRQSNFQGEVQNTADLNESTDTSTKVKRSVSELNSETPTHTAAQPKQQQQHNPTNPMMSGVLAMQLELIDLERSRDQLQSECEKLRLEQTAQAKKISSRNSHLSREVQNLKEHLADVIQTNNRHADELQRIQQMTNDRQETLLSLLQARDETLRLVEETEIRMKGFQQRNEALARRLVEKDMERRKLHNQLQELRGCVRVVVRVRPPGVCKTNALLEKDKMWMFLKNASAKDKTPGVASSPSALYGSGSTSINIFTGLPEGANSSIGGSAASPSHSPNSAQQGGALASIPQTFQAPRSLFEIAYPDASQDKRQIELTLPATGESYAQSNMAGGGGSQPQANTYSFELERVFTEAEGQKDVYDVLAPLIQSALDGYRICVFAYGQTGSGKTYTMLGSEEKMAKEREGEIDEIDEGNAVRPDRERERERRRMRRREERRSDEIAGVIPRAIKQLFTLKRQYEQDGWDIDVTMSMLEIYNERIRDLLIDCGVACGSTYATANTTGGGTNGGAGGGTNNSTVTTNTTVGGTATAASSSNSSVVVTPAASAGNSSNYQTGNPNGNNTNSNSQYKITYSPTTGDTVVQNLTYVPVVEETEVLKLLRASISRRAVGVTDCNKVSSRSHTVFTLSISSRTTTVQGKTRELFGQINLVDLAGSESLKRSHSEGERLKETKHINTSLYELGNVIVALGREDNSQGGTSGAARHIPYRNSLLTMLLKPALSPGAKTLTVVTVSGDEADGTETLNSLRFAAKLAKCRIGVGERRSRLLPERK